MGAMKKLWEEEQERRRDSVALLEDNALDALHTTEELAGYVRFLQREDASRAPAYQQILDGLSDIRKALKLNTAGCDEDYISAFNNMEIEDDTFGE